MYFSKGVVLSFVTSLAYGAPASLLDVAKTSVKLSSDAQNPQHFLVTVERTDDLIDESGETQAERVMSVKLDFDIQDDMLMLNGQDVCNVDQPEPKITTVKATFVKGDVPNPDEMISMFSEGLVSIKVSSTVLPFIIDGVFDEDGMPTFGRHITISEEILEVDGTKVRQSSVSEQVVDVYADGKIVRAITDPTLDQQTTLALEEAPCDGNEDYAIPSSESSDMDSMLVTPESHVNSALPHFEPSEITSSWDQLQDGTQAAIIGVTASLLVSILVLAFALVVCRKRQRKAQGYSPVKFGDFPPSYSDNNKSSNDNAKAADETSEVMQPLAQYYDQ